MSTRPSSPSGPVPEWLDVETAGWCLRDALVTLTQDGLAAAVQDGESWLLIDPTGNERWERGRVLPNGRTPALMPVAIPAWWKVSDVHTPALLCKLIAGRVVAFGDPETTGAQPHWITKRQWQQLRFVADDVSVSVSGAGVVFWNVRIMDVDEYHGLAAAMDGREAVTVATSEPTKKNKGGRPKHNTFEAFVAELVRRADLDGLPETKHDLKVDMKNWLSQTFANDLPTDSTVDSWLVKYAPHRL